MNYIIDTCILIWWITASPKLTGRMISIIENPENNIYVSSASVWEIEIKQTIGKLKIKVDILKEIQKNYFKELPITFKHAKQITNLPKIHKDPFDRIILAQAVEENYTVISTDKNINKYDDILVVN